MIDDNEIWKLMIGKYPEINIPITNPLRLSDKNPGARFKIWNNHIRLYDSASPQHHGKSPVAVYMHENNLSFEAALEDIKRRLSKDNNQALKVKKTPLLEETKSNIQVVPLRKKWSEEGRQYWSNLGVTDLSNKFEVGKRKFIKDESVTEVIEKELTFCYMFDNGFKLYSPFCEDPKKKFFSQVKAWDNWWWNEDKFDTLLTLKASKDYEVVKSIVVENNIPISLSHLQSETVPNIYENEIVSKRMINLAIPKIPNYTKLKSYKRHCIVLDNDKQGDNACQVYANVVGSECYKTPECKDISDMYLKMGREYVTTWLITMLTH